ncbi:MAG: ferredoxin reductase [Propionibacteriales bacterium]|nr:ferredoxin reductase [Propionibacteriales bacterium]
MATSTLRRFAELAVTPLVPDDYLDLFSPLRRGAALRGRVVQVIPETRDAATLVIRPGADWAGHVPGQYVRVGIDVDGVRQWRAYSLTHGPRPDGYISITVKAVPDGVVSHHLVHDTERGTLVHLEQATGDFVLPADAHKLLFVTAGSGVTPVIGMLRNLFPVTDEGVLGFDTLNHRATRDLDIVVVHVAPSEPDSIFLSDLKALDAAGAINLVARYDDQHGLLDVADLSTLVPDIADRITYACGPGGLLDALETHHAAAGLPLYTEQFRATVVVAGEGGTVTFGRSGAVVEADGSTPILEAGEGAGVLMRSGCRMGVCFSCVSPLLNGAVRDLRSGDITTAVAGETDPGGVLVQTCINAAAGPCTFDL